MDIATITAVFGWMTLLSIGYLIIATACLTLFGPWVAGRHERMTGVAADKLPEHYFAFLANFKIAVIILHLIPYVALRIVA